MKNKFLKLLVLLLCVNLGLFVACDTRSVHDSEVETSESVMESVLQSESESQIESEIESESNSATESYIDSESVSEQESEEESQESVFESESQIESESEIESEFESELESESEQESENTHFCEYNELKYDENNHWYECSCGGVDGLEEHKGGTASCENLAICSVCSQAYGLLANHDVVNGKCTVCGLEGSQGLEFELSEDETCYSVVGIGSCTDIELKIPSHHNNLPVTRISYNAFYELENIISVIVPNGVKEIQGGAFRNCINLTSVEIPNSVTDIGMEAFYGCSSLQDLVINEGLSYIGEEAFYGCVGLTEIEFPNSLTNIGKNAFAECKELVSVVIGNNVRIIQLYAFYNCTKLAYIKIGNSVTKIGSSAFAGTAYYNNENNWEGGVLYVGKYLIFANTTISGKYTIKEGTLCVANQAFATCTNLTGVVIPDSVKAIGSNAFRKCSKLEIIVIGSGLTTVAEDAFYDCSKLQRKYYKGASEEWDKISMGKGNSRLTSGTIYYYVENEEDVPTDGGNYWHYNEDGEPTIW